jgi:hypothetical protein
MEDPKKVIIYIIIGLIVMFVLWIFTGGPARYETAKPFLNSGTYDQLPTDYGKR